MNDKKQGSDVPGELPDVGFVPVHKLDPCDTSHLSDSRRRRYLDGPTDAGPISGENVPPLTQKGNKTG